MTTTGIPQRIVGPAPEPPLFTFLTTVPQGPDLAGEEWGQGVQIVPYGKGPAKRYDPCGTSPGSLSASPFATVDTFGSNLVYLEHQCTTRSATLAEEMERLDRTFLSVEAAQVEAQVWDGGLGVGHALVDAGATFANGNMTAVTPSVALAALEQAIAATGRRGIIHAIPRLVSYWTQLGEAVDRYGSRLETKLGTPIVPGYGYSGAAPSGSSANAASETTAFATGAMEWRRWTNIYHPGVDDAGDSAVVDRAVNLRTVIAERLYVVDWDDSLRSAVRVTV